MEDFEGNYSSLTNFTRRNDFYSKQKNSLSFSTFVIFICDACAIKTMKDKVMRFARNLGCLSKIEGMVVGDFSFVFQEIIYSECGHISSCVKEDPLKSWKTAADRFFAFPHLLLSFFQERRKRLNLRRKGRNEKLVKWLY